MRTNCMDNLDRTNVAQAAFAKWTLDRQLKTLGILNEHESIESYEQLIKDFRESKAQSFPVAATVLIALYASVGRPRQRDFDRLQRHRSLEDRLY